MNGTHHQTTASEILITVAAFVIVIAGMRASVSILVPFLLAGFIAIICAPLLFWLRSKGLPTWLSLIIVVLGVLFSGLLIGGLVGSSVKAFSRDLPVYDQKLRQQAVALVTWIERLGVDTSDLALPEIFNPGAAMKLVAAVLNSLRKMVTNGFLILMTVVFMLAEALNFPSKLRAVLGAQEDSLANFDQFIGDVKSYMAIKTLMSLATGIVVAIWLAIIGVDYATLWGLLAFLLNFIPNIGSIIAAVPAVLFAVIQLGYIQALGAAAGYLVINLVMGSLIEPRFMGRSLGLSTLVVFLSLLFWGWVLGPVGMVLSVPLTITAKIALDSREETRWLSVLLGPEMVQAQVKDSPHEPGPEANGE